MLPLLNEASKSTQTTRLCFLSFYAISGCNAIRTKRYHVQHWKPIVQTGMSQLACLNQEGLSLENHFQSPHQASANVQLKLSDTAVENAPPFEFDDEDRGVSITKAFMFFVYGTASGSVWTLLLVWLFQ